MTEPFVAFNETAGLRRLLTRACADAGFQPRIAYESGALSSIRALASAGLGVTLLPLPSIEVAGPPLVVLPTGAPMHRTISLVRSARRYRSTAARAFADLLRERLGDGRDPAAAHASRPPATTPSRRRAARRRRGSPPRSPAGR